MKSRLSLHSGGTEIEDVPHKCILNISTSNQVLHNESIGITPVGRCDFVMLDVLKKSSNKIP